jgi:hypothetical protein
MLVAKATETSGQDFMLVMKAAEKQEVQFSTLPIQMRLVLAIFTSWDVLTASQTNNPVYWITHFIIFQERQSTQNIYLCSSSLCSYAICAQVYLNFAINGEV